MKVILDDHELPQTFDQVSHALHEAGQLAQNKGRMIIEVTLDGSPLDQDQLEAAINNQLNGNELRCTTADPISQVREAFTEASETLNRIAALQSETADQIQAGQNQQTIENLTQIIQLWSQVQQCVDSGTSLVKIDLDSLRDEQIEIGQAIDQLTDRLREIKEALTGGDWLAVSDCLGYEMGPVTEQWRTLLNTLIENLPTKEKTQ